MTEFLLGLVWLVFLLFVLLSVYVWKLAVDQIDFLEKRLLHLEGDLHRVRKDLCLLAGIRYGKGTEVESPGESDACGDSAD